MTRDIPSAHVRSSSYTCGLGIADEVNAFQQRQAAEQNHALAQQRQTQEVNWALTRKALDEIAPEIARECTKLDLQKLEKWFTSGWTFALPSEFPRPGARQIPQLNIWFLDGGTWKLLSWRTRCRTSIKNKKGHCVTPIRPPGQPPQGWHDEDFLTAYGIRQSVTCSLQQQIVQRWHLH